MINSFHIRRFVVYLTLCATLTGCGVFTSYRNTEELPFKGLSKGKLVVLKAEDRIAYGKEFGSFCAEPSPDAISAIASSLGGSVVLSSEKKAELAFALQQTVADIGVRTQSIQLMRDALYRACEAFYSRALNKALYYDLHKRYQDHMIAILAIEQLTGVVKSRQAGIGGTANALVASSTANIQEILADANKIADQEKATLDALQAQIKENEGKNESLTTELAAKNTAHEAIETEIAALVKAAMPPADGVVETPDQKTARETAATDLIAKQAELKTSSETLSEKQKTLDSVDAAIVLGNSKLPGQQKLYDNAVLVQKSVEENLKASVSQAQAVANGAPIFSGGETVSNINAVTVKTIADAVQAIATSAINRPRTSDVCLEILAVAGGASGDKRSSEFIEQYMTKDSNRSLVEMCTQVILGESSYEAKTEETKKEETK